MITITQALSEHHNEMRRLMKTIDRNPAQFGVLKKHLDIHQELKEDLFLKELQGMPGVRNESPELQEEHFVLKRMLHDLADSPQDNFRWKLKYRVLKEILDKQLAEEEEDLFPEAEEILSKSKQQELGNAFLNLKKIRITLALDSQNYEA